MIKDLVVSLRSVRRFKESARIARDTLEGFVDLARLSASAGNLQPLKYKLITEPKDCARVFPHLRWAGYLADWDGAREGERPPAYILILRDNSIATNFLIDHGIALQTLRLAAAEKGLASCIVGTADRTSLRAALELPSNFELLIVLAVGEGLETAIVEEMSGDNVRYWRDDDGVVHVPKRRLKDVLVD